MGYIEYHTIDNDIVKIIYSRNAGPRQLIESFYIKDNSLVFASKHATSYYFYGDSIALLADYYFDNNCLKSFSLYQGEKQNGFIEIQENILNEYDKIKRIILRHQKRSGG